MDREAPFDQDKGASLISRKKRRSAPPFECPLCGSRKVSAKKVPMIRPVEGGGVTVIAYECDDCGASLGRDRPED